MLCIAPTLLSQDVCPSVCLSVTHRYSIEMAKLIIKLFSLAQSHYSSFSILNGIAKLRGGPLMGVSNAAGYEKNRAFRPISRYISEIK